MMAFTLAFLALIAADSPCWHVPSLLFLLLRCGGLCTAHPPPPEGQAERARYKVKVSKKHSLKA